MIRLNLGQGPVVAQLGGPLTGVTVVLNRLTTVEFGEAGDAVRDILHDDAKLLNLLVAHDRLPKGGVKAWKRMKDKHPYRYAAFLSGVGIWLSAVECGARAIVSIAGLADDTGVPLTIERGEYGDVTPETRTMLEAAMLVEAFQSQVSEEITRAARLVMTEGKPSGVSPSGSSERGKTASPRKPAATAAS